MVVTAVDPITGLAIGAPGTTGSGRQSGQSTTQGPPRKDPLKSRFNSGLEFTRPVNESTFINRPTTTYGAGGGAAGASIYDQGDSFNTNALGTDPNTGVPNFAQPGYSAPASASNIAAPGITYDSFTGEDVSEFALKPVMRNSVGQAVNEFGDVIPEPEVDPNAATDTLSTDETLDGVVGANADGTGGMSVTAEASLSDFNFGGQSDTAAIRSWLAGLTAAGHFIDDVREEPPGSGNFYAYDDTGFRHASGPMGIDPVTEHTSDLANRRVENETARLELDSEIQRESLRIQEEMARIDQDIARDRIQHDQEIAQGNWQNALDVQDRIDERERSGRQLERDLFNANQELQNRRFELDRAAFDLDKLEFFQELSSSPANFADLFNISRGLAPTGAGGPMPQGVSRIGQSNVQQTAAQDFRMNGINMAVNANTGALPQVAGEGAVPQFNPAQTQLSFIGGNDPTPINPDGTPVAGAEQAVTAPAAPAPAAPAPAAAAAPQEVNLAENEGASFANSGIQQPGIPQQPEFATFSPESLGGNGGSGSADQEFSQASGGTQATTPEGAPLPPGLQMAFRNALVGAPQTAQNSIPLLSPQALAQLTPAEQEVYYSLAQMQGQYLPDFQNLLASRTGSTQIADSQRVFA